MEVIRTVVKISCGKKWYSSGMRLGQNAGYKLGTMTQIAATRAVINKCGGVVDNKRAQTAGNQTLLFGEEWYRYFQNTYGAKNVEWTSGSVENMFRVQGWAYSPITGEILYDIGNGTNTSWYNSDGSFNYPPNSGAVLGTEVNMTLKPGGYAW